MVIHRVLAWLVAGSSFLAACASDGVSDIADSGGSQIDAVGSQPDQHAGSDGARSIIDGSTDGSRGDTSPVPADGGQIPTLAQPDVSSAGLTSTESLTLGAGVLAGDLLAVCIKAGNLVGSVSDDSGGNWVQVPGVAAATGHTMDIWYAANHPAGPTTVTITPPVGGGAAFMAADLSEWRGLSGSVVATGNGSTWVQGTVAQTGTVTTTAGAHTSLLVGCAGIDSVETPEGLTDYGAGAGLPQALQSSQTTAKTGLTLASAYQVTGSSGTFGFQWTIASSYEQGAIAAFSTMEIASSDGGAEASTDAGADSAKADGAAPVSAFGTGTTYAPIYMCASGGTCTGTAVTGGGPRPSTTGAPNADACTTATAGSNVYACLNALSSVSTATPLVIHSGGYAWSGNTLTVNRPLIGVDTGGGLPVLNRTDNTNDNGGSLMAVPAGSMATWIYGLQLILPNPCYGLGLDCPSPGPGSGGVEYSTLIALGSVNGLTIANNLLQGGGNGVNDAWISHTESASTSTPGARNVLMDGNTFQEQHRCNIDATVKAIGWAAVNNILTYTDGYVAPVDLEPYATTWGPNTITNHEYSYNKFSDPTPAYNGDGSACSGTGNCYVEGMISTGGTAPAEGYGSNIYASHNYGSWDSTMTFLYNSNFSNVHDEGNNIRGTTVP